MRGKVVATNLLIQTKSAVVSHLSNVGLQETVVKVCKTIPFFGSERGVESIAKIKNLINPTTPDAAPLKDVIDRLYGNLTILDSKANGLLRVNSLFLTALVAFLGWLHSNQPLTGLEKYVPIAYIALILIFISSVFCLLIVRISWKFLGQVVGPPIQSNYNFDEETRRLANVLDDRTHYYWFAWWGTLIGLVLPAVWGLILTISKFL